MGPKLRHTMVLNTLRWFFQYNLTCMALDVFATDQLVPVPHDPLRQVTETEKLRDELWEFLETDTVWYGFTWPIVFVLVVVVVVVVCVCGCVCGCVCVCVPVARLSTVAKDVLRVTVTV